MSCKFCLSYDFSKAKVDIETQSIHIAGGNTFFCKEVQFKYCPVCGTDLTGQYKQRYSFFVKGPAGNITGIGICPSNKLKLKEDETTISSFNNVDELTDIIYTHLPSLMDRSISKGEARGKAEHLMNGTEDELDYLKRFIFINY